jgi:protein involved in polysaccharide export with SLBB domain
MFEKNNIMIGLFAGYKRSLRGSTALWLTSSAILLTLVPSLAAPQAASQPSTLTSSPLAGNYPLGTDDVISVAVLRHPEMSVPEVMINASGVIQVPGVGLVTVAGKTLRQVEQQIEARLKATLLRPEVTVALRQARPRRVFVLGPVAKPGIIEIRPGWRISEVVAAAGGLTIRPDLVDATLNRAQGQPVVLNLQQILANSNSAANLMLFPGDTLRLTERSINITVVGQVQKSGNYTLPLGSSVTEALALAGGASPRAALTRATLQRLDGTVVPVDLYKVVVLGQQNSAPKLQQGDLLTIPESNARITVLGAVAKPGFLDIPDGQEVRLSEALALVGGPGERAALTQARLRRADGTEREVDLYQLLVLGNKANDFVLLPNDVLTLPESRGVTVVGAVAKPGTYYLEEGAAPRVADVLALAGGLNIRPEAARISISRAANRETSSVQADLASPTSPNVSSPPSPNGTAGANPTAATIGTSTSSATIGSAPVSIDPVSLLELRDLGQNERVRDGDLISVTAAKSPTVYLSGEVQTPGAYELKEGDSIPELIARAGGPTPLAILSRVAVTGRDGVSQIVNARSAMQDGGQKLNVPLQEGDFVVVPRNKARVYVMQAVNKPGFYPIPENEVLTVGDALSLAGGPKDYAKVKEIAILRQGPNGVQRRVISLTEFNQGRLAVNDTLQNGDVVYVPEGKPSRSAWETITQTVGSLGVLGVLF